MLSGKQRENAFVNSQLESVDRLQRKHPDSLFCPACGTVSAHFQEHGRGIKRANARCPTCGALERHRLLWLCFTNEIWAKLPNRKRDIMHLAPEPIFVDLLKPHPMINYISADLFMPDVMAKVDLTDIQFRSDQLDVIICSHILEHIPDDAKAMREMFRVLKPGGFLLVMVPTQKQPTYEDFSITTEADRLKHFGQKDHVRIYGRDISARLRKAGFVVMDWPDEANVSHSVIKFIAGGPRVVFVCRKPA